MMRTLCAVLMVAAAAAFPAGSAAAPTTTVVSPPPVTPPPITVVMTPVPATVTVTVTAVPPTSTAPPTPVAHFFTKPSGQCSRTGVCTIATNLPVPDTVCAASVIPTAFEPRPDNNTANHTAGPPGAVWGPWTNDTYWSGQTANLHKVTGAYTGATMQIIQWAGCKWGIDEDLIRAVAVNESTWHQNAAFDSANGCPHSFGLTQVKDSPNAVCPINHSGWGGHPATLQSTALNVDFYAAKLRSCYDGEAGNYDGRPVAAIAATNGWEYVLWGCVGGWYSGGWYDSGAVAYISRVKGFLAARTWLQPGF